MYDCGEVIKSQSLDKYALISMPFTTSKMLYNFSLTDNSFTLNQSLQLPDIFGHQIQTGHHLQAKLY